MSGCLDKLSLEAAAAGAELASPRTIALERVGDAAAAAGEFGYPVVVKPRRSVYRLRGAIAHRASRLAGDRAELVRVLDDYGEDCLLQRFEAGETYSFAGVLAGDRLLGLALARYRRTWRAEAGNASFAETVTAPGALVERVRTLARALRWQGIFELELRRRPDGGFAAIDFNPRPYGSIGLAIAAGAPLPALWCDWLLGRPVIPAVARPGHRYRWESGELRNLLAVARRGDLRAAARIVRPRCRTTHAVVALHDPMPALAQAISAAGRR